MIFDVKYKPLLQGGLRPERWRGVHTPPLPQLYRTQAGWGALFIISACWRGLRFYITILGIFLAQTFEKATVAVKSWVFFTKSVDSLRYEIVHSFLYLPFPRTGLTTTVRCTALVPRTWRPSGLRLSSGCRAPAPRRGPPSAAPPHTPQMRLSGEAGR